jgi:hypothetical protein
MVFSAWFFSTLAQATAAIIGLTIAFTVSTHLSRRERRKNRTDDLREELTDLRTKYQPVLDTMSQALKQSNAQFNTSTGRFDLTDDQKNAKQWAAQQPDSTAAEAWAYISGIAAILLEIDILSEYTLDREQFSELNSTVTELKELFRRNGGTDKKLYREITGAGSIPSDYYFEDILDEDDRVKSWWNRHSTTRHDNIAGIKPNDPQLMGKNLFSWGMLFEDLERDGIETGEHAVGTEITTDFMSPQFTERMILTSMKLGFVGVFLPTLFLISFRSVMLPTSVADRIPELISNLAWVADWGTIAIQVGLLAMTAYYSLVLFLIMLFEVHYEVPTMASALGVGAERSEPSSQGERLISRVLAFTLDFGDETNEPDIGEVSQENSEASVSENEKIQTDTETTTADSESENA